MPSPASRSDGVEQWLRGMEGCTVFHGHARFTAPTRVALDDGTVLEAAAIFINVGGRAAVPAHARASARCRS